MARSKQILQGPLHHRSKVDDGAQATLSELARALAELKSTTTELLKRKKELQQLNRWFQIALNNMGRGLSMYDAHQRLIVCNKQYRTIYGLPPRLTRPGTPLSSILRYHEKQTSRGSAPSSENQNVWISAHLKKLARGEAFSYTQHLRGGRIIQVTNQPLAGGGWVDIQEDITERRKAEHRITWLAHHDPLTHAANRAFFSRQLDHAFRQIEPEKGFAIHFVDLDRFKAVNDELGHPVGDGLLKSIAKRMRKVLRETDLLARIGGDEFAIIQTNVTTPANAEALAHRLLSAVEGKHKVAGHTIWMSASVGVAIAPEHGTSAKELMKNVDIATYDAKRAGRARVAVFDPSGKRRLVA